MRQIRTILRRERKKRKQNNRRVCRAAVEFVFAGIAIYSVIGRHTYGQRRRMTMVYHFEV